MTQASTHLTHWRNLSNPAYLGAYAFQPGEEKIVTIESAGQEIVTGQNGKKDECFVLHLVNEKPMIANKTNCKALTKLFGTPYIEEWIGKSFILHVQRVQAGGDTVDAIRVKAQLPGAVCEECHKMIRPGAGHSVEELVKISRDNTGKALCIDCMRLYKNNGR